MANLVTLDDYKAFKNMSGENKYDSQLSIIIAGASETCKTYCRRAFIDYWDTDKVEYHNATGTNEIYLEEFPLRTLTEVAYSLDGTTYTALVENTDFYHDPKVDSLRTVDGYDWDYSQTVVVPPKYIRVTYKAGYKKVPEDLKLAILDLVEHYKEEKSTPRKAFDNMSLENAAFRASATASLPPDVKRVFEMYKKDYA